MTNAHGAFGAIHIALLATAACGGGLFLLVQARGRMPLIRMAAFHKAGLGPSLAMSLLVSTVLMATPVVGPFYLARALGPGVAQVGLVLSVGL